jgi:hypothetical protein
LVASADRNRQQKVIQKGLLNQRLHLLAKIGKQKVTTEEFEGAVPYELFGCPK